MYAKTVLIQTSYAAYGGGEFKTLGNFLFLYQIRLEMRLDFWQLF